MYYFSSFPIMSNISEWTCLEFFLLLLQCQLSLLLFSLSLSLLSAFIPRVVVFRIYGLFHCHLHHVFYLSKNKEFIPKLGKQDHYFTEMTICSLFSSTVQNIPIEFKKKKKLVKICPHWTIQDNTKTSWWRLSWIIHLSNQSRNKETSIS